MAIMNRFLLLFVLVAPLYSLAQEENKVIDVSANVVKIEANFGYNFNDGFAVIQKGDSHALIDKTGQVVIPFNKYKFATNALMRIPHFRAGMTIDDYGFVDGFAIVSDPQTHLFGVINKDLKLVIPCEYSRLQPIYHSGLLYGTRKTPKGTTENLIINFSGEILKKEISTLFQVHSPALRPQWLEKDKYGYVNYFEEVAIAPQFDQAEEFSDGMAAVAQRDSFGQLKWGFINDKGSLEIPFRYSIKPKGFSNGLALVQPANQDEFQFAYIDKKGNVAFTIKNETNRNFVPYNLVPAKPRFGARNPGEFFDGYSLWNGSYVPRGKFPIMLVDNNGNSKYFFDELEKHDWPSSYVTFLTDFVNKEVLISSRSGVRFDEVYAIANVNGEIIIRSAKLEGEANTIIDSLFDPTSKLAKVSLYSNENRKRTISYVNRSGEVTIMLVDSQLW